MSRVPTLGGERAELYGRNIHPQGLHHGALNGRWLRGTHPRQYNCLLALAFLGRANMNYMNALSTILFLIHVDEGWELPERAFCQTCGEGLTYSTETHCSECEPLMEQEAKNGDRQPDPPKQAE